MRFKYYLRGLGLGILMTTIIFIISIRIHGGVMNDDRVIERATELGMIVPKEATTEIETEENNKDNTENSDTLQNDAGNQDINSNIGDISDDTNSGETLNSDVVTEIDDPELIEDQTEDESVSNESEDATDVSINSEDQEPNQETGQDVNGITMIEFVVSDDEVCRTAGEKLLAIGMIEDVDEFRTYMNDNGYAGLIRGGTYEIPSNADMGTIAKIITGQNE